MIKQNPIPKRLPYDGFYILLMIINALVLAGTLLFLVCNLSNIPDTIPMHYNFAGKIDRWGSKYEVFIVFACQVVTVGIVFIMGIFPRTFNRPDWIDERSAVVFIRHSRHFLGLMALVVNLTFGYMCGNIMMQVMDWNVFLMMAVAISGLFVWTHRETKKIKHIYVKEDDVKFSPSYRSKKRKK